MWKTKQTFFFTSILVFFLYGCKWVKYTFKEGQIPEEIKTVSVDYFQNLASINVPLVSQQLTDKMRNKFLSETRLNLVTTNGDYDLKGKIVNYITAPVAVQQGQTSSLNRLTITVQLSFTNHKDPKKSFEDTFSWFADYPSTKPLATVENQLIGEITDKLVQNIFIRTLSDW